MDKETLSNYGWIVILVLILAVMIALATPFGNFIAGAIKSTTAGFFSVNQNAMNAGGITIPGQNFDDVTTNDVVETSYKFGDSIKHGDYIYMYIGCESYEEYLDGVLKYYWLTSGTTGTSSWEETIEQAKMGGMTDEDIAMAETEIRNQIAPLYTEDGYASFKALKIQHGWNVFAYDKTKTSYENIPAQFDNIPVVSMLICFARCTNMTIAPMVPETIVDVQLAFGGCAKLTSCSIPLGISTIGDDAFTGCTSLTDVYYAGTQEQWNQISIGRNNTCLANATIHYNHIGD